MSYKIIQTNQVQDTANTSLVTLLSNTFNQANNAYAAANAAETVVYANGTLVLSNTSLNWNNTSTMNVSVTANGTTQANIAWSANLTAIGIPGIETALSTMNTVITSAYNQANTANALALASQVGAYANGTLVLSNTDINWNNTATMNVSVVANGSTQVNVSWSANGTAIGIPGIQTALGTMNTNISSAYTRANATVQAITAANASNIVISGNSTNVIIDTALSGGAGTPGGSNGQIQFANTGVFGGKANLTYNIAAGMISADANVRIANQNMLFFGGTQANGNANSKFAITYNATSTTLDFMVYTS